MKLTKYQIVTVMLASLSLIGLAQLVFADSGQSREPRAPERPSKLVKVQVENVGSTATLGGTVIPFQEVTLTAQVPGRVEYIAGLEGDWFKENAELIRIDDDDLLAQQRSAMAAMENAQFALRNAGVQYSRELWAPQSRSINQMPGMGMPALFDQMFTRNMGNAMGFGNPEVDRYSDLYAQGTQLNQSRAAVAQARSRLDEITARLRDSKALAPFDGVIARKLVEVGDTVQPGQHLIVFSNLEYLQVKVDVPTRLIGGLKDLEFIPVRLDDPGKTVVKGRIAQRYPVADSQRHTFTVKIDLKKTDPATPGMYAEVMIPEPSATKRSQIVIPSSALISRSRGSLPAVYVWNEERKRKERRYVRLGTQVDPDRVAILSGLNETDTLVIEDWR